MRNSLGQVGAICLVLAPLACRDREPVLPYNTNLGTPEQPLLPSSSAMFDPDLGKSTKKVEIPKRPEPGDTPPPAEAPEGGGAAAPLDDAAQAAAREAIAEAVKRTNAAMQSGEFDSLIELTVAEQRAETQVAAKTLGGLAKNLTRLATAMNEKAAGSGAAVEQIKALLFGQQVQIGEITFESDGTASAPIVGSPIPGLLMHFRDVEGKWLTFSDEKQLAFEKQQVAGMGTMVEEVGKLAGDVESGAKGPDAVQPALQQMLMKMAAQAMSAAATPSATTNGE